MTAAMARPIHESHLLESSDRIDGNGELAAPLLVATDASESADAALRAAQAIAARTGQSIKVLAVHEPLPVMGPEVQLAQSPNTETERRDSLRAQVEEQIARLGLKGAWRLEVVSGNPAATIVNVASSSGATLVIMGLGGHTVFDRFLGDETVLKVLRLGTVPVLAIDPAYSEPPKRILAAVDFSRSSVRALALAAKLVAPGGRLIMAHVMTKETVAPQWVDGTGDYRGAVGQALDRVVGEVAIDEGVTVERRLLIGDPARELLRLNDAVEPDLIVAGSHGHNFLTRLLLGSVSTRLVRSSDCSVLVAPPEEGPGFLDELPAATMQFSAYEWAERLEEFTRRNFARGATLEVIDPEIGAQIERRGARFVGAAFDPRDSHVHLTFGAFGGGRGEGGQHLTRSIGRVSAIQVLRDRSGRDLMLRVAHGSGQTLVTLER